MMKDLGKTSTGIQPQIAGLLCYLLGAISGLVFILVEKENKFVRFHALQSILTFGALFVLQAISPVIPVLGWVLIPLIAILNLILWILLMIKAYQGEQFKLPVVGDIAEQKS